MKTVTICENVIDPQSWETIEVASVSEFLMQRFPKWPDTARIYLDKVSAATDVTPHDEFTANALDTLEGHLWVVFYPQGIETVFLVIAITVAAVAIGVAFLLRPHPPNQSSANQHAGSPNNSLSDRQNRARPNERIPDIYGTLRSTPDLIAQPYRVFEGNVEIEHCYMCIGRGQYDILDVRDDVTPMSEITGASVEVYGPNTSPNSGDLPQVLIGTEIATPIVSIQPSNSVNGQILDPPNKNTHHVYWPYSLNPDNMPYNEVWTGPYIMGDATTTEIWCNFVAGSGLYQVGSDGVQSPMQVTIEVSVTPVDANRNPIGDEQIETIDIIGAEVDQSLVGSTLKIVLAAPGRVSVRAKRITNTILTTGVSVSDDIQWREALAVSPVTQLHFGNVTTVQTVSIPTKEALAIKERKLNLLVTRLLPQYIEESHTFSVDVFATNNAADIFCAMALDPYIGNRTLAELDTVAIYSTIGEVAMYFGTALATEFCYTFDDRNISFEECLFNVAEAVFCTAIRRGSIISMEFEKLTVNSNLLFNHRNKIPGSETRTVTFGTLSGNDGIELDYVDPYADNFPNVDSTLTLYYPQDKTARNAKKITAVGIRNNVQAWLYGWRLFQKMLYQNTAVQFNATQEAQLVARRNRILVADNTRSKTQDGEVTDVNGLLLTLSQKVTFDPGEGYNIFLQLVDGSIQSIGISAVAGQFNKVLLAAPPALPLVYEDDRYAKTTYVIVGNASPRKDAFLVEESKPQGKGIFELKAINYDERYYSHDEDFIDGVVVYNQPEELLPPVSGSGVRLNPSSYRDLGTWSSVFAPLSAMDQVPTTAAYMRGYMNGPEHDAHEKLAGDAHFQVFGFFGQLAFDCILHIKASYDGADFYPVTIKELATNTVLVDAAVDSAMDVEYTVVIPAGTKLNTVLADFVCIGSETSYDNIGYGYISVTDVWITV